MSRRETRMYNANKLKLGLFGLNCSGGVTMTKAPERWDASWENNLKATQLADEAGLEFVLPIGRWAGYGGATDRQGSSFETLTWASGMLGATKSISVFSTVHVSLLHPVFAAKQTITADHVGRGRFGLNVVSGWNRGEFQMFGVDMLEHDARYAYTEEWIGVVKRLWTEVEPFDYRGTYFNLTGVQGKPKTFYGDYPLLMSAGSSSAGQAFAARHADCLFMVILDVEKLPGEIAALRASAEGRDVGVYASSHLISRPSPKETDEYYHYIIRENGDWEAAEQAIEMRRAGGGQSISPERLNQFKERFISGGGTFPLVGSYDAVAEKLKFLSDAGMNGMAIGLINYVNDMPIVRDEILPRLERLALRSPA